MAAARGARAPVTRTTGVNGVGALAVVLVVAFDLRGLVAGLNPPAGVLTALDGCFVVQDLLFVLVGFQLRRRLPGRVSGRDAVRVCGRWVRRLAPLHLMAWAIALAWMGGLLVRQYRPGARPGVPELAGVAVGTPWAWLSSGLLLNGVTGPAPAGYPCAWVLSIGLWACVLLAFTTAGLSSRRLTRMARLTRLTPKVPPAEIVALLAMAAGVGLLLFPDPADLGAGSTWGPTAIGRGLLGVGTGMAILGVLRAHPYGHRLDPVAALVAVAALLFCVGDSELVVRSHLLVLSPVSAAVIFFMARLGRGAGRGRSRIARRCLNWLAGRGLALYVLHPAVLVTVQRLRIGLRLEPGSTAVDAGLLLAAIMGSLIVAELGYRCLDRLFEPAPAAPPMVLAGSVPVLEAAGHRRPGRVIDLTAIPPELRLLPLPRKPLD